MRDGDEAPPRILWLVCALQVLFWTVGPALVSTSPPLDVVEGYLWGREWQLLTYKHPQLPGWLLEIGYRLTGSVQWPNYLISQLFVCAAFWLVYAFGRDILGRRGALAGALLMPALYYCEWVTQQFNHDIAQLPFWAAIVFLLWRAIERDTLFYWLTLGIVAGVGLYAKFSTGVVIGFGGLWILLDPKARGRLGSWRPWLALAIFFAVASPLGYALYADDLLPFRYAEGRTEWVTGNRSIFYYSGVQLAAHAVLAIVVLLVGLVPLRFWKRAADTVGTPAIAPRAFRYLLFFAVGPALVLSVASLFTGVGEAWGTPMFNLSGLLLVALFRRRLTRPVLRRIEIAAPVCVMLWATLYSASVVWNDYHPRRVFNVLLPQAAMSAAIETAWGKVTPAPLRIVAGTDFPSMVSALTVSTAPSYFTDLNFLFAPWVTPARIDKEGMMVVWSGAPDNPPAEAAPWMAGAVTGTQSFDWSKSNAARPLQLSWAIVPPKG